MKNMSDNRNLVAFLLLLLSLSLSLFHRESNYLNDDEGFSETHETGDAHSAVGFTRVRLPRWPSL